MIDPEKALPKTFLQLRRSYSQNLSSHGLAVSEEKGHIQAQTHKQTLCYFSLENL